MGQGQGSISVNQKREPQGAPGPPFLITSADNGLSVDPVSGRIVLGNDNGGPATAALLSNREIPLATNIIRFSDVNGNVLISDSEIQATGGATPEIISMRVLGGFPSIFMDTGGANEAIQMENLAGVFDIHSVVGGFPKMLSLSVKNMLYQIGDISNANSQTVLSLFDLNERGTISSLTGGMLDIRNDTHRYLLGDLSASLNGTLLDINDGTQTVRLQRAAEVMLFLSPRVYTLGNVNDTFLGSKLSVDDANQSLAFLSVAKGRMMSLQGFNDLYKIGDIDFKTNRTVISINDVTQRLLMTSLAGTMIDFRNDTQRFRMGDVSGNFNNTIIDIDDAAISILLGATGGTVTATGDLHVDGGATLIFTDAALTNNAGAGLGTITNAPTAGNPTKWIRINDNGTARFVPTWT